MRLLIALALAAAGAPALAAPAAPSVEVVQPWSRPAAAGTNGVGYMTVRNTGAAPLTLKAVESPVATRTEMHRTSMRNGVMSMRPEPSVVIAPGQSATFGPSGLHVMLIGLKQPLKVGTRFPATLVFASGARVPATFRVGLSPSAGAATAAPAPGHAGHDHSAMGH